MRCLLAQTLQHKQTWMRRTSAAHILFMRRTHTIPPFLPFDFVPLARHRFLISHRDVSALIMKALS